MAVIALLAGSPAWFVGTLLVLGLAVGSFLNVVIYRLPLMLEREWRQQCSELESSAPPAATVAVAEREPFNLMVPRSACPSCKAPITALLNVPLLSWLVLRGRCAGCGAAISVRYPLVELLTALLTAAVGFRLGFGVAVIGGCVLTWVLIALTFIDLDKQLLPDSLTLPLLWAGVLLSFWGIPGSEATLPVDLRSSVIGAMTGYLSLWSVYHLFRFSTGKEGMGYGDFKLFAALGAWLGWQMLLPIILIAAVVGAVVGVLILTLRGQSRATPIAFGPFLAASGWLIMMCGRPLVAAYLPWTALHP
jgi:leader peptidase (prepilin peptidase)/N-methyltransferase